MKQKSIAIVAILSATMLTAVFTTAPPFGLKSAEGQTLPSCPPGYERNILGTCVPIVNPDPDGGGLETEQNIVCSGWSYTCGWCWLVVKGSMEFYPSVDDPEKHTRIIEPWFLNALNKMSDSNTWMKVRK
jgi:hypothetical protein